MINVNVEFVKSELNLVIQHIKELKHRRGQSGQPNWLTHDIRELDTLKAQATIYCMVLAQRHGRVHMKGKTAEDQETELKKLWHRNPTLWQQYYVFADSVPVAPMVEHQA